MAAGMGFRDLEPLKATVTNWVRLCRGALHGREDASVGRASGGADMHAPASDWPSSAAPLRQMMIALGLEPDGPALLEHAAMNELQRCCASCDHKPECAKDLAQGTAPENFYAYCPNARMLDSIYVETTFNRL